MIMKCLLLIMLVFASDENKNVFENDTKSGEQNEAEQPVFVKIEEDDYANENKRSNYIGVSYNKQRETWRAGRWSKHENKNFYNGTYKNEETAALASDTLARKLIANGEKGHKFNFPDDGTEVYREEKSSNYIGVSNYKREATWMVRRWSKNENKLLYNGIYKDEKTAARASDTFARKLIENGEKGHKLNFPDDDIEVYAEEKRNNYIGVSYYKNRAIWRAYRRGKTENKVFYNGSYKDEKTAARASDTLVRKLIANEEKGHKLNFPDDDAKVSPEKRNNYIGVSYYKTRETPWRAYRRSKTENKMVYNGYYKAEETAAHASDILARKLMANGEKGHKLNFPAVRPEEETSHKIKRKRPNNLANSQDNESDENSI